MFDTNNTSSPWIRTQKVPMRAIGTADARNRGHNYANVDRLNQTTENV